MKEKDFQWICNECDFPNLTSAISEEDIKSGRHSCASCGGFEFHKKERDWSKLTKPFKGKNA